MEKDIETEMQYAKTLEIKLEAKAAHIIQIKSVLIFLRKSTH